MYAEQDIDDDQVNQCEMEEDEEVSFPWPDDMNFRSDLKFTKKNLEAMEAYLKKAEMFHHLWIREEELSDIRKAIMLFRDVKQREEEHTKQMELMSQLRESISKTMKRKQTLTKSSFNQEEKKGEHIQPADNKIQVSFAKGLKSKKNSNNEELLKKLR